MTGGGGASAPEPALVVWWRQADARSGSARTHHIGWSLPDQRRGTVALVSSHLWLDKSVVEAELTKVLTDQLRRPFRVARASECVELLDPATRLTVAGHEVSCVDLLSTYGLDVVAGVTAELRGRGVFAHVLHEVTLSRPTRNAALEWAETAIDHFHESGRGELVTAGWQQITYTRWQLLAVQSGQRLPREQRW